MNNMEVLFFCKDDNEIYIKTDYGYQNVTYQVMERWLVGYFNIDPADIHKIFTELEKNAFPERFI